MKRRNLATIKEEVNPIAIFVRESRHRLGYTQVQFAARVGVGLRFLKELELGKLSLKMDKVEYVLNFLGHRLTPSPMPRKPLEEDD